MEELAPLSPQEVQAIETYRRSKRTAVLAILFSDVVGSTQATERLGEANYARIRHVHDELFTRIMTRDGAGTIVKQIGDSFLCVFAEPSTAVVRAVEFQRAIRTNAAHLSAAGYTLTVRIGIHMGQVAMEDALQMDVFGGHVNKAARIEALAGAGETLCSRSVWENAHGWIGADEGLRIGSVAHGEALLKGFNTPDELYWFHGLEEAPPVPPARPRSRKPLLRMAAAAVVGAAIVGGGLAWLGKEDPPPAVQRSEAKPVYLEFDLAALKDSSGRTTIDTTWVKDVLLDQVIRAFAPSPVLTEADAAEILLKHGRLFKRREHGINSLTHKNNKPFFQDTLGIRTAIFISVPDAGNAPKDSLRIECVMYFYDGSNTIIGDFSALPMPVEGLGNRALSQIRDMLWVKAGSPATELGTVTEVGDDDLVLKLDSGQQVSKGAPVLLMRWFNHTSEHAAMVSWFQKRLEFHRTHGRDTMEIAAVEYDSTRYSSRRDSSSSGFLLNLDARIISLQGGIVHAAWRTGDGYPERPVAGDRVKLEKGIRPMSYVVYD